MRYRSLLLVVFLVAIRSMQALAQPLIERVPDDVVFYAGWSGVKGIEKSNPTSHFVAMLNSTHIQDRISGALELFATGQKDGNSQRLATLLTVVESETWMYPTAFYVAPAPAGASTPRVVMMWQADDDAPAAFEKIHSILAKQGTQTPDSERIKVIRSGAFVVMFVGTVTEKEAGSVPTLSLSDSMGFRKTMTSSIKSPSAMMYVNVEAIIAQLDKGPAEDINPEAKQNWIKFRDAAGLTGLKHVIWSGGFDGDDWTSQTFIEAPSPREGAIGLLNSTPLSMETLKLAPKSASWVSEWSMDLTTIFTLPRSIMSALQPGSNATFDGFFNDVKTKLGLDLEQLSQDLGPQWLLYADSNSGGPRGLGIVIINPLRNALRVEGALELLEKIANAQLAARTGPSDPHFQFLVIEQNGVKIHSINLILAAPSWTVQKDRLYLALSMQGILNAVARKPEDGSILDNPDFVQLRKRLGDQDAAMIDFIDLRKDGAISYQAAVAAVGQIGKSLEQQGTVNPLPGLLPPAATILPHLGICGAVSWSDAQGWHSRSLTPFPGAEILGPQGSPMSVSRMALTTGIVLPALGAARRTANQMKGSAQLRGIHQAMVAYAKTNQSVYPSDMGVLIDAKLMDKKLALATTTSTTFPADFDQWPSTRKGSWLESNGSFEMLLWGKKATGDGNVIAGYIKPIYAESNGTSIIYDDDRAEWITSVQKVVDMVHEQYPDHKFEGGLAVETPRQYAARMSNDVMATMTIQDAEAQFDCDPRSEEETELARLCGIGGIELSKLELATRNRWGKDAEKQVAHCLGDSIADDFATAVWSVDHEHASAKFRFSEQAGLNLVLKNGQWKFDMAAYAGTSIQATSKVQKNANATYERLRKDIEDKDAYPTVDAFLKHVKDETDKMDAFAKTIDATTEKGK